MANSVTVLLNAQDNISGIVKRLKGTLDGTLGAGRDNSGIDAAKLKLTELSITAQRVQKELKAAENVFGPKDLGGINRLRQQLASIHQEQNAITSSLNQPPKQGFLDSIGLSSYAMGAALAGIATLGASLFMLKNQLMDAATIQTDVAVTASAMAVSMGVPYDVAKKSLQGLRREMIQVAADLPGETKDYLPVTNSVINALSSTKGSLSDHSKQAKDVSTLLGFVGSATGMSGVMPNLSTKLLGGQTPLNMLLKNDGFEKFSSFAPAVRQLLAEKGMKDTDWTKISTEKRVDFLSELKTRVVTPQLVMELSKGLDSKLSTLTSSIFDSESGIFGFLKPLKGRADQTAIDGATELFDTIYKLANVFIKFDGDSVMTGLFDMFNWFTMVGQTILSMTNGGSDQSLGNIFHDLVTGAITWVNNLITGIGEAIRNMNWAGIGFELGKAFGDFYMMIQKIDWLGVLGTIIQLVRGVILLVGGFLVGAVGNVIVGTVNEMAKRIVGFFKWIGDIFNWIASAPHIMDGVGDALQNFVDTLKALFTKPVETIQGIMGQGTSTENRPWGMVGGHYADDAPLPNVATPQSNPSSTFAPVIQLQANANMSTGEHVDMLLNAINDKYKDYQQGVLA